MFRQLGLAETGNCTGRAVLALVSRIFPLDGKAGSMGKADRNRQRSARERIAAQQAAARKAEARRRAFLAFGSIIGVIAIVVVLLVIKGLSKPAKAASDAATAQNPVSKQIATIPATTFDSVGQGAAAKLAATKGTNPVEMVNGKPEILYMGAEYCPYCAAERWALAAALSRFGTFSNLHYIHSSSTDVYPSTPTLTFYKSTYTSKYVDFEPIEVQGATEGKALQTPTAAQAALINKWDLPPYTTEKGSFPFVDFGNQYLVTGAQYNPQDLAGLSWSQVATDMANPTTKVASDIDAAANSITAAICKITKNAPAAVCTSPAAKAGEGLL